MARDGRILHHNLRVDVDINLFGPMSQVISNSSHRLLSSSGQGELELSLIHILPIIWLHGWSSRRSDGPESESRH